MIRSIQIIQIWSKSWEQLSVIIQSFLNENMEAKIFFTGSTQQRTDLYITILRRNYVELTKEL